MSPLDGPLLAVTCPSCGVASILDHDALVVPEPAAQASSWTEDAAAALRVAEEERTEAEWRLRAFESARDDSGRN